MCHRQQIEDGEKNGSEDDDEEKPGKRVMGPRKKFIWDDKLRFRLLQVKINNEAEPPIDYSVRNQGLPHKYVHVCCFSQDSVV